MLLTLLNSTAIRNMEARLLTVEDLWKNNQVPLALALRPETAKNGKPRTIPLTESCRALLKTYILAERFGAGLPLLTAPLFPSTRGSGHMTRRGLCAVVRRHLKSAGVDGTPHMIRHTAATELLRVSNVRVVQMVLGHSRLDTVMIYTHPSTDEIRDALSRRGPGPKPQQNTNEPAPSQVNQ
jgi:integrase/recombinase XerC